MPSGLRLVGLRLTENRQHSSSDRRFLGVQDMIQHPGIERMNDGGFSGKVIAVALGGPALLGLLLWQCIRFWMAYSSVGGGGNLAGGVVCAILIVAGIVLAARMLL